AWLHRGAGQPGRAGGMGEEPGRAEGSKGETSHAGLPQDSRRQKRTVEERAACMQALGPLRQVGPGVDGGDTRGWRP
ncbi:unnamed protein product, partial [Ectocarpus sp. 12 AP-2014]